MGLGWVDMRITTHSGREGQAGVIVGRFKSHVDAAGAVYLTWYTRDQMKLRKNRKKSDHSGSSFDSFLEEAGIKEEVEAVAIKRVLAWQLERAMKVQQKTKQAMAKELRTSRSQLDRLLDPRNVSVTLNTITRAARALGKRVVIRIADVKAKRG